MRCQVGCTTLKLTTSSRPCVQLPQQQQPPPPKKESLLFSSSPIHTVVVRLVSLLDQIRECHCGDLFRKCKRIQNFQNCYVVARSGLGCFSHPPPAPHPPPPSPEPYLSTRNNQPLQFSTLRNKAAAQRHAHGQAYEIYRWYRPASAGNSAPSFEDIQLRN